MNQRVRIVTLPEELDETLRLIGTRHSTPAMDEFIERELGVGETFSNHDECPICRQPALEIYEQFLFRGPFGAQAIGGRNDPQYVRIQIRQECRHCNVQLWKIPPDAYAKL